MGQAASRETNIMVTGLYDAGKSTLLRKLNYDTEWLLPNIERSKMQKRNLILTSLDVGGRDKIRPLARHFYSRIDAIIYVVDSSTLGLSGSGPHSDKDELHTLLSEEELQHLPVLVVANKQDLPGALTCLQVRDRLELSRFERQRPVEILPTSLLTADGLPEVLDWLDHQQNRKMLRKAVVQPLEKAVPPSVTAARSRVSSALKSIFGMVGKKLS